MTPTIDVYRDNPRDTAVITGRDMINRYGVDLARIRASQYIRENTPRWKDHAAFWTRVLATIEKESGQA